MCALFSFHCFTVWLAFVLAFQHNFYADSCNVFAIVNYRSNGLLAVFDLSSKTNQQLIQNTGYLSWTAVVLLLVSFSFSMKLSYICVWYDKSMICTLPLSSKTTRFQILWHDYVNVNMANIISAISPAVLNSLEILLQWDEAWHRKNKFKAALYHWN